MGQLLAVPSQTLLSKNVLVTPSVGFPLHVPDQKPVAVPGTTTFAPGEKSQVPVVTG